MTCAERMRRIRLMEKMEKFVKEHKREIGLMEKMEKSNRTETENGTMKYKDREGNVLIEATMKGKGK